MEHSTNGTTAGADTAAWLVQVDNWINQPPPTRAQEAAELARDAASYLDSGNYEGAAWRLVDALALIAKKCAPAAAGIGTYTGRGARLDLKSFNGPPTTDT